MKESVISAEGVRKTFRRKDLPPVTAVDGIHLEAKEGELTALIGPDGAGKTTFMRMVSGLMEPDAGNLQVIGKDVAGHPADVQEELSYMPQKFGLYEDLTVAENMNLYADLRGVPEEERKERFSRLLDMTGLAPFIGRMAGKLSGGMKQKLGLICTLLKMPKLLLLDEPTAGIDPLSRRELWKILKTLVEEEHLSVLVSTAYMEEAALCQSVYVMNRGKILFSGTPEELKDIGKGRCFSICAEEEMPLRLIQTILLGDPRITDAVPVGGKVRIITEKEGDIPPVITDHHWEMEEAEPRLEDGFVILLKNHGENARPLAYTEGKDIIPSRRDREPVEIEARDLVRRFGDFTAVSHTSFTVQRGEVFGLLGPNGAGKTTTFRMLCGLLPATSGFLSVAGLNLRSARTAARANIGYVAQKFSLYETLTVRENLRFFGGVYGLHGKELKERTEEVMKEFHLTGRADEVAERLPGGYRQRLSMAAALLHRPKILFLDEPTSGIDLLARRRFWQEISRLSEEGTTIIVTTHFMEEAEYCDRIMIQDGGQMIALGRPEDMREELHMPGAHINDVFIAMVERGRGGSHESSK